MYSLAALCALFYAVLAYRRKNAMGLCLGNMLSMVAVVNAAYLARIYASSYRMASVFTSIYFAGMGLLLFTMFYYALEFIHPKASLTKFKKILFLCLDILAGMDFLLLFINIFHEIVFTYEYRPHTVYAIKYAYVSGPLFGLHLGFCYLIAASVLGLLLRKMVRVPKMYRTRYSCCFAVLLFVVVFNIFYLSGKTGMLADLSLVLYGFVSPVVYWSSFDYTSKTMLNTTRKMILEYMGMPVILFDYEGFVADTNRDMRRLFPVLEEQKNKISIADFMQIGAFKELQNTSTDQTFEWYNRQGNGSASYQCNFICLKDEKKRDIGRLLLMRDMSAERDMVTRLYTKQYFFSRMAVLRESGAYPITVVVCNANSIGLINDVFGWEKGNEMIRMAADLLKEHLPQATVLARMNDGDIAAGFAQAEQEYASRLFEKIAEQYRQANTTGISSDLEYGVAVIRENGKSVEQALREAGESMRTKKLMNATSQKSSLLDSLSQTLTESDYETEEHVERTKEMATKLGKALHLTDSELGKLALLAVLHDIGKIAIPHTILLKPAKLTEEEWEIMKTHTEKGYRIASASKELQPISECILHHHERWDGKGYPDGLTGEDIPLLSRIITVVDSHDVMVHDRPYHKAMSDEEAVEELRRCSGTQFDPHIVDVFLEML